MSNLLLGNNTNTQLERSMGVDKLDVQESKFNKYVSAVGVTLSEHEQRLAFNLAQPKYMIIGYIMVIVIIGLFLLIGLSSEIYNSQLYKILLFSVPLFIFMCSWFIQYMSNMSKDNDFSLLFANYKIIRNTQNINMV